MSKSGETIVLEADKKSILLSPSFPPRWLSSSQIAAYGKKTTTPAILAGMLELYRQHIVKAGCGLIELKLVDPSKTRRCASLLRTR